MSQRFHDGSLSIHVLFNDRKSHEDLLRGWTEKWPGVSFVDLDEAGMWEVPEDLRNVGGFIQKDIGYSLAYHKMCDLWATKVPAYAGKLGLEYYLRLDADAMFSCPGQPEPSSLLETDDTSKVITLPNKDVFETMRKGHYVYGYYMVLRDDVRFSSGFHSFVQRYVDENGIDLTGKIAGLDKLAVSVRQGNLSNTVSTGNYEKRKWAEALQVPDPRKQDETVGSLAFYNNLEIVQVPFLQRPDVVHFTEAIVKNKGIYTHRWGDAIIRFYQVTLFSKPDEVRCLSREFFYYKHQWGSNIHCDSQFASLQ
jgi:hypothetical protein